VQVPGPAAASGLLPQQEPDRRSQRRRARLPQREDPPDRRVHVRADPPVRPLRLADPVEQDGRLAAERALRHGDELGVRDLGKCVFARLQVLERTTGVRAGGLQAERRPSGQLGPHRAAGLREAAARLLMRVQEAGRRRRHHDGQQDSHAHMTSAFSLRA